MPQRASDHATRSFEQAERRLFAACGVQVVSRRVRLADPPVAVRVLEAGDGPPLILVHGSGMSASTWAPLMPYLGAHRLIAFDLPGFGLSDAFDYSGRSLRAHAVAQLTSLLDALGLERAPIVGTSLGGMWALCLALDAPDRVAALASLGVPAVALPGMHGDPFFTALSTPGVRQLAARMRSPNVATTRRTLARGVVGPAPPNERRTGSSRSCTRVCASPATGPRCSPTCSSPCGVADPARRTFSQRSNCGSSARPCS